MLIELIDISIKENQSAMQRVVNCFSAQSFIQFLSVHLFIHLCYYLFSYLSIHRVIHLLGNLPNRLPSNLSSHLFNYLFNHPFHNQSVRINSFRTFFIICFLGAVTTLVSPYVTPSLSPSVMAQSSAGITSPAAGSSVSGSFPVMGTAVIEPFQRYEIYIKQEPNGDDAYIYIAGGTEQIVNGQLGVLDANAFAPGIYTIRLRVVKLDGNYGEYFAPNISINQDVEPTPTATSDEPTVTPIPTVTFTPAPQPTPNLGQVEQPQVQGVAPTDTPTTEPVAAVEADESSPSGVVAEESNNSDTETITTIDQPEGTSGETSSDSGGITSQLGEALAFTHLRTQFFDGMQYSAIVFALVALLFLVKGILRWMRTQL